MPQKSTERVRAFRARQKQLKQAKGLLKQQLSARLTRRRAAAAYSPESQESSEFVSNNYSLWNHGIPILSEENSNMHSGAEDDPASNESDQMEKSPDENSEEVTTIWVKVEPTIVEEDDSEAPHDMSADMDESSPPHDLELGNSICCNVCGIVLDSLDELKEHFLSTHAKKEEGAMYGEATAVEESSEDPDAKFGCDLCEFVGDNEETLAEHRTSIHESSSKRAKLQALRPRLLCSICNYAAGSIQLLEDHVNRHHVFEKEEIVDYGKEKPPPEPKIPKTSKPPPPSLKCDLCDFAAEYNDLLKQHKETAHGPKKPLPCPHCEYAAVDFKELKIHVSQEHTSDEPQLCNHCEYIAPDPEALKTHKERVHPKKKYQCHICDYSSQYPSHVSSHIRAQHTKEKPFKCPHCDFRTVQASQLKPHINSKHSADKPHKCGYCDYSSAQAGNLKKHVLKKHTNDMPHKCPYCEYGSAYPGHLKNHIMVKHTNERPHKCTFCSYSAAQLSQLKTHVLAKHTNIKPYVCHLCNYGSATPTNLKYHIRAKHPETEQDS